MMEAPLAEAIGATTTMEYGALIAVAALALAVYDFVLNIGDEVAFIWRKSIRSGSILFIWIRYYGLLTITLRTLAVLASTPGVSWLRTAAVDPLVLLGASELAGFVLMYSVQIVLQIRVHVMYQSTGLASFNALLFLTEIVVMQILWGGEQPFNNVCADIFIPFPGARLPKDSCEPTYPLYLPTLFTSSQ
ncbi:hypothetical protein EXIGLDRAFT_192775 [Exidia glandulosa HHB12029]|uniref:DUF6533 domain-containing protein n=1 Tax=Exidia glandulosa HHB12029 TaxID=1314781 RepID=A0A165EXC8_EXIGL|nr:hypothetical protein EXIGLDRAFT_192775 [Exidia glandulosa HHB12029]